MWVGGLGLKLLLVGQIWVLNGVHQYWDLGCLEGNIMEFLRFGHLGRETDTYE